MTQNKLTACWTKSNIIHSEFYFPILEKSVFITALQKLTIQKDKPIDLQSYQIYSIDVSWEQFNIVYSICQKEQGKPFDRNARWWFLISWLFVENGNNDQPSQAWICSKFMAFCCK